MEKTLSDREEGFETFKPSMLACLQEKMVSPELKRVLEIWGENIFMLDSRVKDNYQEYMQGNSLWQVWGAAGMLQVKVEEATKQNRDLNPKEIQEIGETFAKAAEARGADEFYKDQKKDLFLLAENVPLLAELMKLAGNRALAATINPQVQAGQEDKKP